MTKDIQNAFSAIEDSRLLAEAFAQGALSETDPESASILEKIANFTTVSQDIKVGLLSILFTEVKQPLEKFQNYQLREAKVYQHIFSPLFLCIYIFQFHSVGEKKIRQSSFGVRNVRESIEIWAEKK